MKWHGGRNAVQDESGEWSPGGGFTYLTFLANFPGLFAAEPGRRPWAHEYSQPVQVNARLRVAEVRDWNVHHKQSFSRLASCELVVDDQRALCVMPSTPVSSCAQAKRIAAALIDNEDWVQRGLRWFYGEQRRIEVVHNLAPYATLFAQHADWLLSPGNYQLFDSQHSFEIHRSTCSVTRSAAARAS